MHKVSLNEWLCIQIKILGIDVSFGNKVKESIVNHAAEGLAIAVMVIIIWVASKVGPAILPALEANLSKSLLVTILLGSLSLNIVFVVLFLVLYKKPEFKLKYGIYWDTNKNPHCPNCKIPISAYNKYQSGWGYYCKPCGKIFPITDAEGNDIKPEQALREL